METLCTIVCKARLTRKQVSLLRLRTHGQTYNTGIPFFNTFRQNSWTIAITLVQFNLHTWHGQCRQRDNVTAQQVNVVLSLFCLNTINPYSKWMFLHWSAICATGIRRNSLYPLQTVPRCYYSYTLIYYVFCRTVTSTSSWMKNCTISPYSASCFIARVGVL